MNGKASATWHCDGWQQNAMAGCNDNELRANHETWRAAGVTWGGGGGAREGAGGAGWGCQPLPFTPQGPSPWVLFDQSSERCHSQLRCAFTHTQPAYYMFFFCAFMHGPHVPWNVLHTRRTARCSRAPRAVHARRTARCSHAAMGKYCFLAEPPILLHSLQTVFLYVYKHAHSAALRC